MPVVSIVLPVYNVERYLSFCLDSLRAQTLRDIEIICVVDGSTDRSIDVVRMHAAVDSRVRVIERENKGVSSARNTGFDASIGDYVLFVDSDDFLEARACEVFSAAFAENDADVVTFGARCVPSSASDPWLERALSPRSAVYKSFDERLLFDENSRPFMWRTALRRDFVKRHDIRFDEELSLGEDQVFHFEVYPLSGTTVLLSDKLYNYRASRKDSAMDTLAISPEYRVPRHLEIVKAILRQWQRRGLMGLCPERLMDWILGFLCIDIFNLVEDDQQVFYLRKLGVILDDYFDDPVAVANATFPVLGELVSVALNLGERDQGVPASLRRRYVRYRIGLRQVLRSEFGKMIHFGKRSAFVDAPGHPLEKEVEEIERENELSMSLLLLLAENMGAAYSRCDGTEAAMPGTSGCECESLG